MPFFIVNPKGNFRILCCEYFSVQLFWTLLSWCLDIPCHKMEFKNSILFSCINSVSLCEGSLIMCQTMANTEKAMAPTPVLLPGKSHGWRSLVGCSPWGREESDTTVGHGWATSLSLFTFMHWRRKWQPTPVFLPGESQGRGSLVGCRLWGCTESDTTEVT